MTYIDEKKNVTVEPKQQQKIVTSIDEKDHCKSDKETVDRGSAVLETNWSTQLYTIV